MEESNSAFSLVFVELIIALVVFAVVTYLTGEEGFRIWMFIVMLLGSIALGIKLGIKNCFLGRAFGVGFTFGLLCIIMALVFIKPWDLGISINFIFVITFVFIALITGLITFTANAITRNIFNKK